MSGCGYIACMRDENPPRRGLYPTLKAAVGRGLGPNLKAAVAAATLTGALAGCGVVVDGGGMVTQAPEEVGQGQVGLELTTDPSGSTIPIVEVFIADSGPYRFILDTGASRTLVESGVAEDLDLPTGAPARGWGVAAEFEGVTVRTESWRIGDIPLEPRDIVAAPLPQPAQGPRIDGLLGSDVLAGFGVVEIDYDRRLLTLVGDT